MAQRPPLHRTLVMQPSIYVLTPQPENSEKLKNSLVIMRCFAIKRQSQFVKYSLTSHF